MQGASESMLLGSPPGPAQQSPFLPAYLMGDTSIVASPASRPWSSPPRSHLNRSVVGLSTTINSPAFCSNLSRSESVRARDNNRFKDRPGAPPVHGLIESVSGAGPSSLPPSRLDDLNQSTHPDGLGTPSSAFYHRVSDTPAQLFNQSCSAFASPAQLDPFYTQGESISIDEQLDQTWVTVFGFPPAATSYILQEFSQYGNIVKHVIAADGNWLHIHYQSKLQAKKALSKNGKVFGGSIMVGVAPCIDKTVMEANKENTSLLLQSSFQCSSVAGLNDSRLTRSSSLRPLTASFKAASADTEVIQQAAVPQRNNSIISKAMEYVFGW